MTLVWVRRLRYHLPGGRMLQRLIRTAASAAVLIAYTGGCAAGARGSGSPVPEPRLAAEDVRAASGAWAQAAVRRDADAMGEYFGDDVFAMYPQPQPTIGRAANLAAWRVVFAQSGVRHPITSDSVVVAASGDLAYSAGRWHLSIPATGANAGTEAGGRYLVVWRPVGPGGAWRIVTLSANTLRPAPDM